MEPIVKTVEDILNDANTLCDDNVNHKTLLTYFNNGVVKINSVANLKLPILSHSIVSLPENAAYVYDIAKEPFVNNLVANILINYVAKMIRQTDGYGVESNEFDMEFNSLTLNFQSKFIDVVKPEFRLGDEDGGSIGYSRSTPRAMWLEKNKLY